MRELKIRCKEECGNAPKKQIVRDYKINQLNGALGL